MSHISLDWNRPLRAWLEGIPLDLASSSLPLRTWLRPGPLLHIHLHARTWKKFSLGVNEPLPGARYQGTDRKAVIINSLLSTVEGLKLRRSETCWSRYYRELAHYSLDSEELKRRTVTSVLESVRPARVLDLGGNIGTYGRLATEQGIPCVCLDFDALCVNHNYLLSRRAGDAFMLPLVMDITDPSPSLGFDSSERLGFLDRPKPDLILALGIVHHLRINGNIPLPRIAQFLAKLSKWLLIEYIPREDDKVRKLLQDRDHFFEDYSLTGFFDAFGHYFERTQSVDLPGTLRSLHLFRRRS